MGGLACAQSVGDDGGTAGREWRRSSRTYGGGNCVEVAPVHGQRIDIRDSKNPTGAVLRFTTTEWNVFVADLRRGESVL
jgi:hypothetical protein